MTYTSTPVIIGPRLFRLAVRDALRPIPFKKRFLLVSDEVADVFDGHRNAQGFPVNGDVIVSDYLAGMTVNVSMLRRKRRREEALVHLEKIVGVDEVWALCVRKPVPGWRFFGRFVDKNVLVLLTAYDKGEHGENYGPECDRVEKLWTLCLPGARILRGNSISDYISGPYYDTDQKQFFI